MKRLDVNSLPDFVEAPGLAVILVGFDDAPTKDLAEDFAQLWAECIGAGLPEVRFGYVDAMQVFASRGITGAAMPPVILILQDGETVFHSARHAPSIDLIRSLTHAARQSHRLLAA